MKSRPILFSAQMVRALLDGSKTQTRRAAKLTDSGHVKEPGGHRRWHPADPEAKLACPYGQPGDQLWVRETFYCDNAFYPNGVGIESMWREVDGQRVPIPLEEQRADMLESMYYRADGEPEWEGAESPTTWRPSIHMPRWASRITLEVLSVRVERLQDITEADSCAEGVRAGQWEYDNGEGTETAKESYQCLWDSINAKSRPTLPHNTASKRYARIKKWLETHPDTTSWDANPWVWVVEFKRAAQ